MDADGDARTIGAQLRRICHARQKSLRVVAEVSKSRLSQIEHAAELAQRTGEGNPYSLAFSPTNIGLWWMDTVLEAGDRAGLPV